MTTPTRRRLLAAPLAALAAVVALVLGASPALAYPPTPPSADTARSHLAALTVRAEGSLDGYSRDLFPHWISQGDGCDTREVVLQRDGSGVSVDSACRPTSGSWYSVYDAVWVDSSSGVDIDHIVPLAEAWRSGASGWTTARRQQLANDLTHAQLIAVSASSNRSKGDSDPAQWKPTNTGVWCIYARDWIDVKYVYDLSVDAAEENALSSMLDRC